MRVYVMTIYIEQIDKKQKTIFARVDHSLTAQDIVDYFTAVDKALEPGAGYTEHIDFTETTDFSAEYGSHTHFDKIARKVYESEKYTNVVCIVKTDHQFGSIRMYASLFRLTDIIQIKRVQ